MNSRSFFWSAKEMAILEELEVEREEYLRLLPHTD
jgi:hypothetical protein